jgi:hypothetical protein
VRFLLSHLRAILLHHAHAIWFIVSSSCDFCCGVAIVQFVLRCRLRAVSIAASPSCDLFCDVAFMQFVLQRRLCAICDKDSHPVTAKMKSVTLAFEKPTLVN